MHVDGWLCEIKDVQIRDGLHVLGQAPTGEGLVNLVLAILRSNQVFGGQVNGVPGLRTALGLIEGLTPQAHPLVAFAPSREGATGDEGVRLQTDEAEEAARALVEALADAGWRADAVPGIVARTLHSSGRGPCRRRGVAPVRLRGGRAAAGQDER